MGAALSHANQPGPEELFEERLALVSALQELTVAALELFDPRGSADNFLERVAERLGCYATLLIASHPEGPPTLQGATGLAPSSRALPIDTVAIGALLDGRAECGDHGLPYPELASPRMVCWRFPVHVVPASLLLLFFEGPPQLPDRYQGMLRRLADILGTMLEHRNLFARSIENERKLDVKATIIECLSEASPQGVLFIDSAGEIAFYNRRFVAMWGVEEEIASHSVRALRDAALSKVVDRHAFSALDMELVERPERELRGEVLLRDGRTFEIESRPVVSAHGAAYGRAMFFRDITEQKRAEAERETLLQTERAARTTAEDAIRARDEFLSVASHELRTPLTSLLLAVRLLSRDTSAARAGLSPEVLRSIDALGRQAQRLVRLVDGLLDVSRIRAGRLKLELEEFDLREVARDVVRRYQPEAGHARSELVCEAGEPVVGRWDRSRIDQVVSNLVANAIKYGAGGRIDVRVGVEGGAARIEVQDHGIGIAGENIGRLFQRFERAASPREYGGLGLGLFIVREIVEMHGGRVHVTSLLGAGSTFVVLLPLERPGSPSTS
jgi:PAS domain S-box-containing protein